MANYKWQKIYKNPKDCHACAKKLADIMGSNDSWIECLVKGEMPVCKLNECRCSQEVC
jgi:hypothetical protein